MRPQLLSCAAFTFLVSFTASVTTANDWPQFLGPNRNGVSAETNLLDTFPEDGPEILWRQPLGPGMSGIAVAGDSVFTLYQDAEKQYLIALDVADGKKKWEQAVAPVYQNAMGNGPRATPTVHEGTVYAYTGEGILVAADAETGKVAWSTNAVKELFGKVMDYGMASSPLIAGGNVVVQVGSHRGTVAAFDLKEGKLAWKAAEGDAGYSSPIIATLGGKQQIIAFAGTEVLGIDSADGEVLWKHAYETDFGCNTACPLVISEDRLLVSAGENHGSTILKITDSDGTLKASAEWESFGKESALRAEWQTPVQLDGHLYALDNMGSAGPITNLVCLRLSDHEKVWSEDRFGKSNLILADGKLFISTMRGELLIARASPKGFEETARAIVLGMTRQAPVIANGKLYLRDEKEIVCLNVKASQEKE